MVSKVNNAKEKIGVAERSLVALILFFSAMAFCLPVPFSEDVALKYPWWGSRIAIGNVQLHEILFLAWCAFFGWLFVLRVLLNRYVPARQAAVWLIVLALWCGMISLTSPLLWLDIGRTFRLLLNAVLLLATVHWTRQTGNFTLGMLIFGFLIGTIINLVLSYQYPLIINGTMRLSGQNTPGVAMGIAIHLTAWLFFRAYSHKVKLFALSATFVFAFACAFSYSRIGWFAGGLGLLAWVYVLYIARPRDLLVKHRLRKIRVFLNPLLVVVFIAFIASPIGYKNIYWLQSLAEQKLSRQHESNAIRWAYFNGTIEIISQYPLGVGYSGFFGAMTATDTYRKGDAVEEESVVEANPHASFLWYTTAGGIPGSILAVLVFVLLLNSMRHGLISDMGKPGVILFVLSALSFLVIGLTVPYLFNSIILIIPAAIAAGWGWSRWLERKMLPIEYFNKNKREKNEIQPLV